jgi:polar amino acid transport system substrate-binding protein
MHTKTARAAALLVLLFCAAGLPAACDWGSEPEEQGLTGTPLERATEILGAAPTGAAARVIERGTMVVANDADYPPQSSVDESTRELVGFDVDVAKRVAEILGLEVSFKNPDWETIPAGLKQGRIDASIGSMAITPEHDKVMDFTRPYYFAPAQVVAKEGGAQITGVGDLAGKKVGVGLASTYRDYLAENSTAAIKTYPADADAFPDLLSGELDFALTAQQTAQQAIGAGGTLEFSGTPLFYEGLGIAAAEGETDWVKLLDYAVATMLEDGSLSELSRTWYDGLDLTAGE